MEALAPPVAEEKQQLRKGKEITLESNWYESKWASYFESDGYLIELEEEKEEELQDKNKKLAWLETLVRTKFSAHVLPQVIQGDLPLLHPQ